MIDLRKLKWKDHLTNPLINPEPPEVIISDPTVLTPDQTPDGKFHLMALAVTWKSHKLPIIDDYFVNVRWLQCLFRFKDVYLNHYISDDGIVWKIFARNFADGFYPQLIFHEDQYYLFYEVSKFFDIGGYIKIPYHTLIKARTSTDLINWSAPIDILKPNHKYTPWESWCGITTVGCPHVVRHQNKFRLYYSSGAVYLPDFGFFEPKFIGFAESDQILGPYKKHSQPIIKPDNNVSWRNLGAGAVVVFPPQDSLLWQAFENGIYLDKEGRSRSELRLLNSSDGIIWHEALDQPVLSPTEGWKKASVYRGTYCCYQSKHYFYYNARDGWLDGIERIGLAIG